MEVHVHLHTSVRGRMSAYLCGCTLCARNHVFVHIRVNVRVCGHLRACVFLRKAFLFISYRQWSREAICK